MNESRLALTVRALDDRGAGRLGGHAHRPRSALAVEAPDDPRILELMKEYEAEWERGRRPDASRLLARYPDLAPVAAMCLDGIDLLYQEMLGLANSNRPKEWSETGLASGGRLGEFEIIREIGRGGMGVVYEAAQRSLNRQVAIKVLPRALAADRNRLRRFEVEARAAAAVDHPHIVPVYAVGEDRGVNYYVMRFVDGSPLDSVVAAMQRPGSDPGPETPRSTGSDHGAETCPAPDECIDQSRRNRPAFYRTVARFGAAVARALDHTHQNGVIHRDIKPANLLLGRDGHIWVTDFGLAQFTEAAAVTGTGAAIGTLRYMSPEQTIGDRRHIDHRTDIYSLAATLYELLTGWPAFPAEEPATLLRQIPQTAPPAPRTIDPTIPRDLETVLLKGLEKDPRDRYATAAGFADDLDRFLTRRPVTARRPSAWDRSRKWVRRHPTIVWGAALLLLLLASASGLIAALSQRAYRAERDRADEAEQRIEQTKKLGDLMIQISEEEGQSIASLHGTRRRLLLAALENYRQLNETKFNDPQVRAELDRVMARIETLLVEEKTARESLRVGLLWFQSVRTELGLSPDQNEQLRRLFQSRGLKMGTTGDGLGTVRDHLDTRDKIILLHADAATRYELLRPLTGPQRKRLGELFLQCFGPKVFSDPEVIETLALSPFQQQQIRALKAAEGYQFSRLLSHDSAREESIDSSTDLMRKIVELLTPEQRNTWSVLIGKPFDLPW